jgi:hypothetical protein
MSDRERLHNDDPVRTGPIRNFLNLYRQPDPSKEQPKPGEPETSEKSGNGTADGGPLSRGVELAYRVLEEYFAAGRRSAEQISRQTYNAHNSFSGGDSLQDLIERLLRFQSEILPLWVDVLGRSLKPDASRSFMPPAASRPSANGASNNGPTTAYVEVASLRLAQVLLELGENANFEALTTQGLRTLDPNKPPLTDISFRSAPGNGRGSVRIRIPDSQPPGIYSSVVVDRETGETRGILSVRIEE